MNIFAWIKRVCGFKATQNDSDDVLEMVYDAPKDYYIKVVERPKRKKLNIKRKKK
jgi:hypothetical protein